MTGNLSVQRHTNQRKTHIKQHCTIHTILLTMPPGFHRAPLSYPDYRSDFGELHQSSQGTHSNQ